MFGVLVCPRRCIMFHVDNEAVVHILNSQTSPDPNIMHLLRSLHVLKADACFSFTFAAIHVPGRNNGIADTLSRFSFQAFNSQAPQAKQFPILIHVQLFAQLSIVTYTCRSSLPFIHVSRPCFFNSPHLFLCPGKVRKFLHHDWTSQPL